MDQGQSFRQAGGFDKENIKNFVCEPKLEAIAPIPNQEVMVFVFTC